VDAYKQKYEKSGDDIYATMSADATCRGLRSARDGQFLLEFSPGKCPILQLLYQSLDAQQLSRPYPSLLLFDNTSCVQKKMAITHLPCAGLV